MAHKYLKYIKFCTLICIFLLKLAFFGSNLPIYSHNFLFSMKIFSYGEYFQRNYLKLFVLSNYSISFGYSNTIRIVFAERVITRYLVCTDLPFEYIFGIRFVQKFTIRWNSDQKCRSSHCLVHHSRWPKNGFNGSPDIIRA